MAILMIIILEVRAFPDAGSTCWNFDCRTGQCDHIWIVLASFWTLAESPQCSKIVPSSTLSMRVSAKTAKPPFGHRRSAGSKEIASEFHFLDSANSSLIHRAFCGWKSLCWLRLCRLSSFRCKELCVYAINARFIRCRRRLSVFLFFKNFDCLWRNQECERREHTARRAGFACWHNFKIFAHPLIVVVMH